MSVQNILARNIAPPGPREYVQINFKKAISNVRKEQESTKGVSNWAATERFFMRGGLGEGLRGGRLRGKLRGRQP